MKFPCIFFISNPDVSQKFLYPRNCVAQSEIFLTFPFSDQEYNIQSTIDDLVDSKKKMECVLKDAILKLQQTVNPLENNTDQESSLQTDDVDLENLIHSIINTIQRTYSENTEKLNGVKKELLDAKRANTELSKEMQKVRKELKARKNDIASAENDKEKVELKKELDEMKAMQIESNMLKVKLKKQDKNKEMVRLMDKNKEMEEELDKLRKELILLRTKTMLRL